MTGRDRIVIGVVALLALVAGYWFLVLGPKRSEAQKLSSQVSQAERTRDSAVAEAAASRAAQAQYPANYATVARLGKAVPVDDDIPSLVYQLATVSHATDIDFREVKLATAAGSGSGGGSSTPPPPAGGSGGSSGSSPPGGSGNAAAPVAASQSATAGLPPGAVVGTAGLPTMPFSFTFQGGFFRLSDFFARLDALIRAGKNGVDARGRLLTVDGLSLSASPKGFPNMTATVAATAFLVPPSEGATNGATPNAPPQAGASSVANRGPANAGTSTPAATLISPVSP